MTQNTPESPIRVTLHNARNAVCTITSAVDIMEMGLEIDTAEFLRVIRSSADELCNLLDVIFSQAMDQQCGSSTSHKT
jgi:hypothetical protein